MPPAALRRVVATLHRRAIAVRAFFRRPQRRVIVEPPASGPATRIRADRARSPRRRRAGVGLLRRQGRPAPSRRRGDSIPRLDFLRGERSRPGRCANRRRLRRGRLRLRGRQRLPRPGFTRPRLRDHFPGAVLGLGGNQNLVAARPFRAARAFRAAVLPPLLPHPRKFSPRQDALLFGQPRLSLRQPMEPLAALSAGTPPGRRADIAPKLARQKERVSLWPVQTAGGAGAGSAGTVGHAQRESSFAGLGDTRRPCRESPPAAARCQVRRG